MKHDKISGDAQETAALYALGALSQHEARAFERHLGEGCQVCEAELAQFERTAGLLGLAASPVTPPPQLLDALKTRLAAEIEASSSVNLLPSDRARVVSPRRTYIGWAAAACLALACVVLVYLWQAADQELTELQSELARNSIELQELEFDLGREQENASKLQQIIQALKSPGVKIIPLAAQPQAPKLVAEVYWDKSRGRWLVEANLAPAPQGKVYQLWFVTESAPVSAGLLKTDSEGHAFTVVEVPTTIGRVQKAAITLEPEGGSAQPTLPILAVGDVTD